MGRKPRHIPQRTCVGCRTVKGKNELIRVVRRPTGEVEADFTGKVSGRGAYICPDVACLQAAVKANRLDRALQAPLSPQAVEALEARLAESP